MRLRENLPVVVDEGLVGASGYQKEQERDDEHGDKDFHFNAFITVVIPLSTVRLLCP